MQDPVTTSDGTLVNALEAGDSASTSGSNGTPPKAESNDLDRALQELENLSVQVLGSWREDDLEEGCLSCS